MSESKPSSVSPATDAYVAGSAAELVNVLDQYLAELQAGRAPERGRFLAEHPELAGQLEQCLAGIEFIHRATERSGDTPAQLGDFRILREIGRGGMGVVYEAEQISLNRKVALKVLRFGSADEGTLERFRREAETVAHLHHTNIVPIFAVGCEQGVNYYAMQYIEGQSLADKATACQSGAEYAAFAKELARWGLEAAEALAHAHQRGVIHRDVKPSNLLLDQDGRIWLTDFGLAKRADEVTMTAAGVIMGTPRYMSPEQASSLQQPIDHRTDIYSLGATLYELATGKPVFVGDTPQGVITQILSAEPVPPRRLQTSIPRDLETIILKCLAKEAGQRYASAQSLAADLRAFREDRPIQARRPSLVERSVRWARKHRRSAYVAGVAALAAVVVIFSATFLLKRHQEAQLGRVSLSSSGPNLLGEVLDEHADVVRATFPVPTTDPVILPAGSYRLRLSSSGLLSETWPLQIDKGSQASHEVLLRHQLLWRPIELEHNQLHEIVNLSGRGDIMIMDLGDNRLRRLDGRTGKSAWPRDVVFSMETAPATSNREKEEWCRLPHRNYMAQPYFSGGVKTEAFTAPADLNGDGVRDLVLASGQIPHLAALSGKDGSLLWWHRGKTQLPAGIDPAGITYSENRGVTPQGGIIGYLTFADLDGDAVTDFIAIFYSNGDDYRLSDGTEKRTEPEVWVGAISGKTGKALWRHSLSRQFPSVMNSSDQYRRAFMTCSPKLGRFGDRSIVVMAWEDALIGLDSRTGAAVWSPVPLPFKVARFADVADLDGDGNSEALLFHHTRTSNGNDAAVMTAITLKDRSTFWEVPYRPQRQLHNFEQYSQDSHLVEDLDGDGVFEVVRPDAVDGVANTYDYRAARGIAIEALDGATGRPRWRQLVYLKQYYSSDRNIRLITGPDLDGDGCREVFAAWYGQGLMVAALSGKDGAILWRWQQDISGSYISPDPSGPLRWWQIGPDGWPMLLVPVQGGPGGPPTTFVLSGATGRLQHTIAGVMAPQVADFNGDGIPDLCYTIAPQGAPRLVGLAGRAPEPWRKFDVWQPAEDFDGDGFTDLVQSGNQHVTAVSGRDGRALWQSSVRYTSWTELNKLFVAPPMPYGDLDGDGVPDIVRFDGGGTRQLEDTRSYTNFDTLAAFSGKDGHRLWTADDFGFSSGSGTMGGSSWSFQYPFLDWCDLDGDGHAEIIIGHSVHNSSETRLTVLSGKDGKRLVQVPLGMGGYHLQDNPDRPHLKDLNGDGIADFVMWLARRTGDTQGPFELQAFSGKDGTPLWARPALTLPERALHWPRPAVGDLDGDGHPEIITVHAQYQPQGVYECQVIVLDGRDGRHKWHWTWQAPGSDFSAPLLVDFDGKGRRCVCLRLAEHGPNNTTTRIMVFEPDGKERMRIPLSIHGHMVGRYPSLWRHADLDGDGKEELVYFNDGKLHVARGDGSTLWSRPLHATPACVLDIQSEAKGRPATVTLWDGAQVFGLDGSTGKPGWRCDVPYGSEASQSGPPPQMYMLKAGAGVLPRFVAHWPAVQSWHTAAQQAWPSTAAGEYQPTAASPMVYTAVADNRWPRYFPFAEGPTPLNGILALPVLVALLGWLAWRRRWGQVAAVAALALLVTAFSNIPSMLRDARSKMPEEYYTFTGWYIPLLDGAYYTVVLVILCLLALAGYRLLRRLLSRWSRRHVHA